MRKEKDKQYLKKNIKEEEKIFGQKRRRQKRGQTACLCVERHSNAMGYKRVRESTRRAQK